MNEKLCCHLCQGGKFEPLFDYPNLRKCQKCGLILASDGKTSREVKSRYSKSYFYATKPELGGYEDYLADEQNIKRTFRRRTLLIDKFKIKNLKFKINSKFKDQNSKKGIKNLEFKIDLKLRNKNLKLLDVGCAAGFFLEVAREQGFVAQGLDISDFAVKIAQSRGHQVIKSDLVNSKLPANSFDLVTMWDLLEHVEFPDQNLKMAHRLLKKNGLLVISTPDAGSFLAQLLGSQWLGYRSIGEHRFFFSRQTLKLLLKKAGFEIINISSVGKYISSTNLHYRLQYYSKIAHQFFKIPHRLLPKFSIYVNPGDTMMVIAKKK